MYLKFIRRTIVSIGLILSPFTPTVHALDPFASLMIEGQILIPSLERSLKHFQHTFAQARNINPLLIYQNPSYNLIIHTLSTLHQHYVRPLDLSSLIDSATQAILKTQHPFQNDTEILSTVLKTIMNSLNDPHSSYLNPKLFNQFTEYTTGTFVGIGIQITLEPESKLVRITDIIPETPAQRANLRPNDLIHKVNGNDVLQLDFQEVIEKIKGPIGTFVNLTIERTPQQIFNVTVQRQTIHIPSHTFKMLSKTDSHPPDIAYIQLSLFNESITEALRQTLIKIQNQNPYPLDGIILDLRDNPGGLLSQALGVTDLFLPKGKRIISIYRRLGKHDHYFTKNLDSVATIPLVVLINENTASASEILAAALQDHKRALLFGTRSFGKGSIQNLILLEKQGALRLTTDLYVRPSGELVDCIGVLPNVLLQPNTHRPIDCPHSSKPKQSPYSIQLSHICPDRLSIKQDNEDQVLLCAVDALRNKYINLFLFLSRKS